jgi:selenoprotein W-related protein
MPDVSIVYCQPCGYLKRAQDAAAALQAQLDVAPELVPGTGGIFEVRVDDRVVIQRSREGFPDEAQIVAAVSTALRG